MTTKMEENISVIKSMMASSAGPTSPPDVANGSTVKCYGVVIGEVDLEAGNAGHGAT